MHRREFLTLAAGLPFLAQSRQGPIAEISADVLEDKIRGGFLGQVIGDLNGLEHEMKYIAEPGNEVGIDTATYAVQPRSIVVLIKG